MIYSLLPYFFMEFFETVRNRHSIREFQDKEVEEEKLQKVLECCNSAPSAGNAQAYKIFLVKDKMKRRELSGVAGGQGAIAKAPVALVFCANPKESGMKYGERGEFLYSIQDATIATSYCQLAATALGLSTVWVGAFDEEKVKEIINTDLKPVAIIPLGYAGEDPEPTTRKSIEEIIQEC